MGDGGIGGGSATIAAAACRAQPTRRRSIDLFYWFRLYGELNRFALPSAMPISSFNPL